MVDDKRIGEAFREARKKCDAYAERRRGKAGLPTGDIHGACYYGTAVMRDEVMRYDY